VGVEGVMLRITLFKNRLGILQSMVARMPPSVPHCPHLIPSQTLKGLKFKQQLRDQHHTRFGGIFNPWCGIRHGDAFAKFGKCGFITKMFT